jgi:site-specific DNA-methyltransferase (adenine-specific)
VSKVATQSFEHSVRLSKLQPHPKNPRKGNVAAIEDSIEANDFYGALVVQRSTGYILAGNHRYQAARKKGMQKLPVVWLDVDDDRALRILLADNRLNDVAAYDEAALAELLKGMDDLTGTGWDEAALAELLGEPEETPSGPEDPGAQTDRAAELAKKWKTEQGQLWLIGEHRLICGDCRDKDTIARLFSGACANVVVTSPPYASQREYDPSSGFRPIPPDEYVDWYRDVAGAIESVLAPDGSYFLNIKEHCEGGQRHLYVKDLTLAHVRQWGWRFIDELCWRKTSNGVPGGWNNRFKNAWEPVFHFSRQSEIKFRPYEVGQPSDDCFEYSPANPRSASGSKLLGKGPRGQAAGSQSPDEDDGYYSGVARPSNVVEAHSESSQGEHSAPFPRALVEFFVKGFTDPKDIVYDPFLGSGSSMAAADALGRVGYGTEICPSYCAVILERMTGMGLEPKLETQTNPRVRRSGGDQ